MKQVVSVSLGSTKRDHQVEVEFLGEKFKISRRGTDGNFDRAIALLQELDGRVDAIGLGGLDVYIYVGQKRYAIRDGLKLMEAVKHTPVADGSGLKNTLEREAVYFLARESSLIRPGTRVLMVSSMDRFGMAEALSEVGCDMTFGDLIFTAGIPYPIKSVEELEEIANKTVPEMVKMPIHMLYPTGRKQEEQDEAKVRKFASYYHDAEVIAGDFHLIRRYMPDGLNKQVIFTNTTTRSDVEFLTQKGAGYLITTTPVLSGRSFGTNVMEAVLVVLSGKPQAKILPSDYLDLLQKLDFHPQIIQL